MKRIIALVTMTICVQSAFAATFEQQQEALRQLDAARAEINVVRTLIPGILKKSIGRNLENADERIAYAQQVLAATAASSRYYCTVESTFDGQFAGRGNTQLEASNNAMQSCRAGSRQNGFFCDRDSIVCQKEQ